VLKLDDDKIIALYFERNESALKQTAEKYGRYCYKIAHQVVNNEEDAKECVNDMYLDVWNSIPPHKPKKLAVFLATITRRIALDCFRRMTAEKRGGGEASLSLHELEDCIPFGKSNDEELENQRIAEIISAFLRRLPEIRANIFIRRYWYFDSVADIAKRYDFGESKTKMILKKTRDELLQYLKKEDIFI
jgi:RNA polymerase sigma-70 factor (ECF subfamily)